jgi:hypothetical protein
LILAGAVLPAQTTQPRDRKALELGQARRDRGRFEPLRPALEGAEAVYKEGSTHALVRLTNIVADDWGVKAKMEMIADLASDRPLRSGWDISAVWSIFIFSERQWYARYVSWHIYLDKDLVRAVKAKELDAIPVPIRRIQLDRLIAELDRRQSEQRKDPNTSKKQ